MRYRILNNGKDYIIQASILCFFWETVKYCIGVAGGLPIFSPIRFKAEKEAENYAKVKWRKSRERIRKYQIV